MHVQAGGLHFVLVAEKALCPQANLPLKLPPKNAFVSRFPVQQQLVFPSKLSECDAAHLPQSLVRFTKLFLLTMGKHHFLLVSTQQTCSILESQVPFQKPATPIVFIKLSDKPSSL